MTMKGKIKNLRDLYRCNPKPMPMPMPMPMPLPMPIPLPMPKPYHRWKAFYGDVHPSPLQLCFFLSYRLRGVNNLEAFHAVLIVHGYNNDLPSFNELIFMYGKLGLVTLSRSVFDQLPSPDFNSFHMMLKSYSLNKMYSHIIPIYVLMRANLSLFYNDYVFYDVLKACYQLGDVVQASKMHCHFLKTKLPGSFVLRTLVDVYYKCRCVVSAWQLFDEIPEKNDISWSSTIVAYVNCGIAHQGWALFLEMREGFLYGNECTIGSLVKACTYLKYFHQGKWVHGFVIKIGVEFNSFLVTSLLDMYVKFGRIEDARSIFDEFSTGDIVLWTAMIAGYTQRGYPHMALELFTNEKWAGVLPNSVILGSLLSACAQLGNAVMGKSLHAVVVKSGLDVLSVRNALEDMYAKSCITLDARYEENDGIAP